MSAFFVDLRTRPRRDSNHSHSTFVTEKEHSVSTTRAQARCTESPPATTVAAHAHVALARHAHLPRGGTRRHAGVLWLTDKLLPRACGRPI